MPKITQYTCNTPHKVSQKYIRFYNISFETWKNIALPYQNLKKLALSSLGYIIKAMG